MEIALAVVADDATVSSDGKLSINGIFDTIRSAGFPAVHPRMVFVFSLRASFEDSQRRFDLRIRLVDEDGQALLRGDATVGAPEIQPGGRKTLNQIFRLQMVRFPHKGTYKFVIEVREEGGSLLTTREAPFILSLTE